MSHRRGDNNDIQNKGCDWEIEAIFFKNWAEIKKVLYKYMFIKVRR